MSVKFRDREAAANRLYDTNIFIQKNKLCGLLCKHGECEWGISYLLSGREQIEEEEIVIAGKSIRKEI